jgi:NADH dehydrogenase FAD-containing subunit
MENRNWRLEETSLSASSTSLTANHRAGINDPCLRPNQIFTVGGLPQERAVTMKWLGDAIALRNRLIEHLEEADTECASSDREPLLTFVVAGGGFGGVETIGSINDFLKKALPYYPNLKQEMVLLVHPGKSVLPELGEELGRYTSRKLAERGVEIHPNTKVKGVTPREVELTDGTRISSFTLVWTAGTSPHPLLHQLDLPKERNRLKANAAMGVEGFPGVWALGDCAMIPNEKGGYQPPTAQHASREGKVLAHNIVARIRGNDLTPFRFKTLGRRVHLDLFYDYRTNVALYPKWQAFLRERQPETIIFWAQDDIFFTRAGGEAYLEDLPKAEMHRLEAGHFAVEDCLDYISEKMHRFYRDSVAPKAKR